MPMKLYRKKGIINFGRISPKNRPVPEKKPHLRYHLKGYIVIFTLTLYAIISAYGHISCIVNSREDV